MMNLERELVFCFIEEDNVQRAYFRVRPLLTIQGDVQEEARRLWPDEGCLRIVPDRNEQHTFKDRMRSLGGWCVMNLVGIPADANKIRTNKNYRPERNESNQYILYSDTVQAAPEHTFFEMIDAQPGDYASAAAAAITPQFYLRSGDTLYGPIIKANPQQPAPAAEAQGVLYPLSCPDGKERTILCIPQQPDPQPDPKPDPKPADEALPLGKPLEILDKNKGFEETLQNLDQPLSSQANLLRQPQPRTEAPAPVVSDKPLTGTPLFRAPVRTSTPQVKNKLQEVVAAQWKVARNDPPASELPAGAQMRHVENPVENACESLRSAWQVPEAQTQLIDFILSLDGMRAKLEPRLSEAAAGTSLQNVLQNHLQDLEAERLSILLQLDKAKADLAGYRRSVMDSLAGEAKAAQEKQQQQTQQHLQAIEQLRAQQDELLIQRNELQRRIDELQQHQLPAVLAKALADAQIAAPVNGIPLRMSPVSGQHVTADEMISRVMAACAASGIQTTRNHAAALLTLLAVCPRIGFTCSATAAAATLAENIARGMGWSAGMVHQVSAEQKPLLSPAPADATPALLLSSFASFSPMEGVTKLLLARNTANLTRNVAYETSSWPIFPLDSLPFIPVLRQQGSAVSAASLAELAGHSGATATEADSVLSGVFGHILPLSGEAMEQLHRFVSIASALMEGGLTASCDWAILLWILPSLERTPRTLNSFKPLLEEFPLSRALLEA